MKLSKAMYIVIILVILISILLYYLQFRRITYTNTSLNFTISYPVTWKHTTTTDTDGTIREGWSIETGGINEHSGRPNSIGFGLFIYSPENETWTKHYNEQISRDLNAVPDLMHKTQVEISGKEMEEVVAPGAIWIEPLEHSGKMYYFSGYNDEEVKKIIATFKFID